MTLDEQDEFIQQVMANRDTAMAAVAESTTHTGTSEGTLVEQESMSRILSDPVGE
jgi:hypothetical protein